MKLLFLAGLLLTGCARFTTVQEDTSYDPNGKPLRKITTRASAWTAGESKSALSSFKASQTDKTQSATVGGLNLESSDTNIATNLEALTRLIGTLKVP